MMNSVPLAPANFRATSSFVVVLVKACQVMIVPCSLAGHAFPPSVETAACLEFKEGVPILFWSKNTVKPRRRDHHSLK